MARDSVANSNRRNNPRAVNKDQITEDNFKVWSVGAGFSNFIMHGDLRSLGTGIQGNYFNIGGYAYVNRMFNPVLGMEFKVNFNQIRGGAQYLSEVYDIVYVGNTRVNNNLFFEGTSIGAELNVVLSLSNLFRREQRKFNVSTMLGIGYHIYDSALYETTDTGDTNLLVDFGSNPARNSENNASSIFLTQQLSLKYRFNQNFDFEFRTSYYLNYEDHLDASISNKQDLELFFVNHLGVIYKFGNRKTRNKNHMIWVDEKSDKSVVIQTPQKKLLDSDKDGVPDEFDVEPTTPIGAMVYGNGRAIDSDKDGLQDFQDECPLKPGPAANKGCPELKDSDGDGLYDFEDLCPVEKGPKENRGCPVPKNEEPQNVTIIRYISELAANVYFDTGKWTIKSQSIEVLDQIASYMNQVPDIKFTIEGHTDDRAADRYNLFLSEKRADAVYKYLLRKGIDRDRLSFKGYGEMRPKFSNATAEGRQLNRRVEIKPDESSIPKKPIVKTEGNDEKKTDDKNGENKND